MATFLGYKLPDGMNSYLWYPTKFAERNGLPRVRWSTPGPPGAFGTAGPGGLKVYVSFSHPFEHMEKVGLEVGS